MITIPRPRVSHQVAEPVNRTSGFGLRGPGTRVAKPAPVAEDDADLPDYIRTPSMLPDPKPKPVRRGFNDWKPKS